MSTTTGTFKKGDKVSFSFNTRTGITRSGKGVVTGRSQNSARVMVKLDDGTEVTLWPSALRAA